MRTIAFVTQKGGSGKSTLCISLAVAAQEAGHTVCILEIDRQATASDWVANRTAEGPEVAQIDAARLQAVVEQLRKAGYHYVFIDTPGVDNPGTVGAMRVADLCLVPCRPTPADLRAFKPTLGALQRLEKPFAFVLNQTPPKSYRVRDTAEGLAVLGLISPVNVVMRNDHQDAIGMGQGVTEFNPTGPAAAEIRRLWEWVETRTKEIPMSKPPKLDLKTLIAQGQAAQPDDLMQEPAPAPTAKVLTMPPSQAAAPAKAAAKAAPEREGQGTLKERARQMSLYLEPAVYEQLRELAFTERTKIHPLLIEAIDLLFKKRGLKSIKQLTAEADKDQRITG